MENISSLAVTIDKDIFEGTEKKFSLCDFYKEQDTDIVDIIITCLNLIFAIPAILGNLLVLLAIRRTSSMGLPSKVLLASLACSDFSVGLIVHPSFALHKFLRRKLARCIIGLVYDVASGHLSLASLLTMVFISLDKFMALHLKLRYRTVVTYKRSIILVSVIWTISFPWSASYLFHTRLYFFMVLLIIPLSFLVSSIVFAKIYTTLRRQQDRLSMNSQQTSRLRPSSAATISRYKYSVTNMLYVYCALLAAYLPIWIVLLVRTTYGKTTIVLKHATEIALLIVLINSTVNPVLYLSRIREIRQACFDLLRRVTWRRTTMKNVENSTRSEPMSLEPRIQPKVEIRLENKPANHTLVKGVNSREMFTTYI